MNTVLARFFHRILTLLLSVTALFSSVTIPDTSDAILAQDAQTVKMTAILWGDPQISDYQLSRASNLKSACLDITQASVMPDALVLAGDLAENGKGAEYLEMIEILSLIPYEIEILPAFGNHDIRLKPIHTSVQSFKELLEELNENIKTDTLYYSYRVKGYRFLVLGSTASAFEECKIDETELKWLETELNATAQEHCPVFVVVHQPLKNSHDLPDAWNSPFNFAGSIGEQSDVLMKLLGNYDNVFLITGHLHSGLKKTNFEEINGIHSVNLPSIGIVSKDGGLELAGCGYMIEVYDEKVIFRARDFINGRYLPEYNREFALVG